MLGSALGGRASTGDAGHGSGSGSAGRRSTRRKCTQDARLVESGNVKVTEKAGKMEIIRGLGTDKNDKSSQLEQGTASQ